MTSSLRVPVLASCALMIVLSWPAAAAARDRNSTDNRDLQRSIYETIEGRYAPLPEAGPYVMEGRSSVVGPPPGEPRMNEWQRYEESNTPLDMEPATRPQD
jgi:hypothetical protein